ncbi:type II secretion system protein [Candidatus Saccharibacteria bacterium]|nr:type II secretion system protein [Candidatus Saccharibacteria bacterium]
MAKDNINSKKGFTIIEVVLVLAIAGLIFLMVFVALPALQRSQRDTQRRNDLSRVDTSLVQYQTNHSNQNPNLPNVTDAVTWIPPTGNNAGSFMVGNSAGCGGNVACEFVRDYMNTGSSNNDGKPNNFEDPEGVSYSLTITPNWGVVAPTNVTTGTTSQLEGDTTNGFTIADNGGNSFDAHMIYIIPGGRCSGDHVVESTKNHFAVLYRLEGAGAYCIDDQ